GFMAPEQAVGEVAAIDARTDLWAVAASLYQLLSGRVIHDDVGRLDALLARTATIKAAPLASIAPWVSPETCTIVDRGLALVPEARCPSADAMKLAIEAALERLPTDEVAFAETQVASGPVQASCATLPPTSATVSPLPMTRPRSATFFALTVAMMGALALGTL